MAKFVFKRSWYSKHFAPILLCVLRYLVVFGGRGSGKTRHIILKILAATYSSHHTNVVYCRHQFETLRKTTFADIVLYLKNSPLGKDFHYSESDSSSMVFTNKITGHKIVPFGLDDPEKTKGIAEATIVWIDEVDKCTQEQVTMINSVLRTPQAKFLQLIVSFNPTHIKSWLREFFFHPDDPYKAKPEFGDDILVHHSTVYDNEYIDVEAYVQTLMMNYAGNSNAINVNLKGLWGIEDNTNPWLYNFDRAKHVKASVKFLPSYPIYLSFDFNRDPISCTVWQMSPSFSGPVPFVHCIDEFGGQVQLKELCQRIKTAYPHSIIYVTGDSSGNKGDVAYNSRHDSAYTMIRSYLNLSPAQMQPNISNLEHENSRLLCNAIFYHFAGLGISPKCVNLINDCEIAAVDEKAAKPNTLKKDRGVYKMDYFDSKRYFFQRYLYDYVKKRYLTLN